MVGYKSSQRSGEIIVNWQDIDITVLAAELPGKSFAWLKDLRAQQWAQFLHNGLPTPKNEAWKYTKISSLAQQLGHCERRVPTLEIPKDELHNAQTTAVIQLNFVNSHMTLSPAELPAGVVVSDLCSALSTHPDIVKRALSEHQSSAEGMINFNTSLWQNGVFIFVPDEVVVDKPLIIHYHAEAAASNMLVLRNLVFLGKNSQLTLIQHFSGENETPYWQHSVTQIDLADHAKLTHVKCQNEGREATHLSEHLIQQATQSVVHSSSFALGAKLTREAWQVNLGGSLIVSAEV
jgi:Fe-S cluster assembly protein SufD